MPCEAAARLELADELPLPGDAEDILRGNLERLVAPELARRVLATPLRRVALRRGLPAPAGLSLGGAAICSASAPEAEAEAWADSMPLGDASVGVVLGMGLGHPLQALRRRTSIPLLVLEPSLEVLRVALSFAPLSLAGARIVDSLIALREALEPRLALGDVVKLLAWPAYRRLFPELVQGARGAVSAAASMASVTALTLDRRLRIWTRNLLANLPACVGRVPLASLDGLLRGCPAILVAAGPSLDHNVAELRRARGRAVVIAVNTSLGALERAGVAADLVAAVEVLDVTRQLAGLGLNRRCPRALALTSHPQLFQGAEGPVLPFSDLLPFFNVIASEAGLCGGLPMGGSVSNATYSLARLLGADPVVLVGQDLAYSDGRVYASGTIFEKMRAHLHDGMAELDHLEAKRLIAASLPEADTTLPRRGVQAVTAWGGGGQVSTTLEFNYFRANFERYARDAAGATLINATEGGARIHGFQERRLAEVLDGLPERDLPAWPAGPALAAAPVRRVLARELELARRAPAQCQNSFRAAGAGETDLSVIRRALAASPILQAFTCPTVQRALAGEMPIDELGRQLGRDIDECADLLEEALRRVGSD